MKVYNVLEEKGGTSKSTTVQNLAYGLSRKGYRVLVIDLDPQANTTGILLRVAERLDPKSIAEVLSRNADVDDPVQAGMILEEFVRKRVYQLDSGDVLLHPKNIESAILHTEYDNLDIIPSSARLSTTDIDLKISGQKVDTRLAMALDRVRDSYDYAIIDNSPFINSLGINAIHACQNEGDLVIIPVKVDQGGLEGYVSTFRQLVSALEFDENLEFDFRILTTMVNRNASDRNVIRLLRGLFGNRVLETEIRYQAKPVSQSSLDKDVLMNSRFRASGVADDYRRLVEEIEGMR